MPDYAVTDWLSDAGGIGAAKLIRQERRTNAEWWVKIVTPLLAALISLLGLVVALVTVSRK
jgi:lipopolysaccharide export LptBFGC system permease protein LptF